MWELGRVFASRSDASRDLLARKTLLNRGDTGRPQRQAASALGATPASAPDHAPPHRASPADAPIELRQWRFERPFNRIDPRIKFSI